MQFYFTQGAVRRKNRFTEPDKLKEEGKLLFLAQEGGGKGKKGGQTF